MPMHLRRPRGPRRSRRTATLATAVAAAALTTGLLTACDPTDTSNSLDCLQSWNTISDSLKAIHESGTTIDEINADSDDSRVTKAVDDLDKAISDYNKSILNGDTDPDSSKIDAAAKQLKDVCAS